jgi:hypothetical protein
MIVIDAIAKARANARAKVRAKSRAKDTFIERASLTAMVI